MSTAADATRDLVDKATAWDEIAKKNAEIERLNAALTEQAELARKSIRRMAELAEPGSIGAFASRDHWKERALAAESALRSMRAETVEACAIAAENFDHRDRWSSDEDLNNQGYWAAGETCDDIAKAIRSLAQKEIGG